MLGVKVVGRLAASGDARDLERVGNAVLDLPGRDVSDQLRQRDAIRRIGPELDPCSSAAWFAGWRTAPATTALGPPPVAVARTWLARMGWRRHGLIHAGERPR